MFKKLSKLCLFLASEYFAGPYFSSLHSAFGLRGICSSCDALSLGTHFIYFTSAVQSFSFWSSRSPVNPGSAFRIGFLDPSTYVPRMLTKCLSGMSFTILSSRFSYFSIVRETVKKVQYKSNRGPIRSNHFFLSYEHSPASLYSSSPPIPLQKS